MPPTYFSGGRQAAGSETICDIEGAERPTERIAPGFIAAMDALPGADAPSYLSLYATAA